MWYTHAGCFFLCMDVPLKRITHLRAVFYYAWMYLRKGLHICVLFFIVHGCTSAKDYIRMRLFLHNMGVLIALCYIHTYSFLLHMDVSLKNTTSICAIFCIPWMCLRKILHLYAPFFASHGCAPVKYYIHLHRYLQLMDVSP